MSILKNNTKFTKYITITQLKQKKNLRNKTTELKHNEFSSSYQGEIAQKK